MPRTASASRRTRLPAPPRLSMSRTGRPCPRAHAGPRHSGHRAKRRRRLPIAGIHRLRRERREVAAARRRATQGSRRLPSAELPATRLQLVRQVGIALFGRDCHGERNQVEPGADRLVYPAQSWLWLPAKSSLNCGSKVKKSWRMKRAVIGSPPVSALILLSAHRLPSSVSLSGHKTRAAKACEVGGVC